MRYLYRISKFSERENIVEIPLGSIAPALPVKLGLHSLSCSSCHFLNAASPSWSQLSVQECSLCLVWCFVNCQFVRKRSWNHHPMSSVSSHSVPHQRPVQWGAVGIYRKVAFFDMFYLRFSGDINTNWTSPFVTLAFTTWSWESQTCLIHNPIGENLRCWSIIREVRGRTQTTMLPFEPTQSMIFVARVCIKLSLYG